MMGSTGGGMCSFLDMQSSSTSFRLQRLFFCLHVGTWIYEFVTEVVGYLLQ